MKIYFDKPRVFHEYFIKSGIFFKITEKFENKRKKMSNKQIELKVTEILNYVFTKRARSSSVERANVSPLPLHS